MTPFETLAYAAGIYSIEETSQFLELRRATAAQYWHGEFAPPEGVILELYEEYLKRKESEEMLNGMTFEQVKEMVNRK